MIGFFEHQYLTYKKNHIRNLLELAKSDGHIHEKEEKLLFKIGKRYGLKEKQIAALIQSEEKHELNIPDNYNDKMDLLYDLISMVYADGRIDKSEVKFCEDVVIRFGMKKELVQWLLKQFEEGTPAIVGEWDDIKAKAKERFVEV